MFRELLQEKLEGIVVLSRDQVSLLEAHYELLKRWNQTLNLTRIENAGEAVERHYCESLFLGAHLPSGSLGVADLGSGGGFPGFPVAVLRPDCFVTLVESHQRKAVFLKEVARSVPNVRVVAKRGEEVPERFDHVISRAVSYGDLTRVLKVLGANADLLTGSGEPPAKLGFIWQAAIPVPWGKQRFLRIGQALS
ncbi:MAG: 16S rRNA (guanine(527)-N(7))-methyltransferase RsmG [Candidatus Sulfopaludibacter sp.]|nr:16S rRNA (guanine(527)-N(7))-methyltransferase RsmG [Candidatus Sulfopaludibacter sp.]